ncbi:gaba permease [Microdochium trichocladiopsis]|uniref:Gaba permease n=1 Tax=Microdochium trichocladiopsis TaxID=1682393 RepID=A0A9P8XXZ1_9PEZI|nr:gaba permease [Microdochium trichocladiopsis]KAH7021467.1 gaba permease [Microdochium trichocladiopsis]
MEASNGSGSRRPRTSINENDSAALARLGVQQELERNFSTVSMLGLAFAILNSWTALSASLSLALPSGGPSAVLWGLIVAGVCNLCLAASLAEFLSAYPTAGGQYHWAAIVAWPAAARAAGFVTGWINVAAWVCLTATGGLLGSQLVVGAIALVHPDYVAAPWHQFLIYIAYTLAALLINATASRLLPAFTKAAFFWSLAGFAIISITVLACAPVRGSGFRSGAFVYGAFINTTGWPDGLAWLLGLLQGAFALTGFDATIHMIEELPSPQRDGPRIMLWCIGIGMFTGWVFLSCLLFVVDDVDNAIASSAGPLLYILHAATDSTAGAICLLMFPLVCMLFTTTSIMATSSRMSMAFARDRGLPFSRLFAKVNRHLGVPLYALLWTTAWVIIFGCVFLGSSDAFNAIVSASVVALGVTYAIPPTINCLRRRRMLPETRPFKLNGWVGWTVNLVGIAWTALTTVLFVFPAEIPVTSTNMNYCVVAFGVILIIAVVQWIIDGRKNYKGPQVDIDAMNQGEIVGATGATLTLPGSAQAAANGSALDVHSKDSGTEDPPAERQQA